jgi:hypothetical protein
LTNKFSKEHEYGICDSPFVVYLLYLTCPCSE